MTATPIAIISSSPISASAESPKLSISIAKITRRIACASTLTAHTTSTVKDSCLPQFTPELFALSETSPTNSPSFFASAPWLRTLATMGHSACKDKTMQHLLRVEDRILIERDALQWNLLEDEPISLSSESTTESFSEIHAPRPQKKLDDGRKLIFSSALLLADRSRVVLSERQASGSCGDLIADEFLGGIAKSTRSSVIFWMKKVVESMKWPISVFFTAVHAMDYTLPSEIRMAGGGRSGRSAGRAETVIPLLSVACVLVGVSSECEHKHLSKTRCFVNQVPNVTSVKEIICKELSVVARLNKGSLLHKTPVDFVLYFISRLKAFDAQVSAVEGTYTSLYKLMCNSQILVTQSGRHINQISNREGDLTSELLNFLALSTVEDSGAMPSSERILSAVLEVTLAISLTLFSDSLHRVVPASRLLALVMMHMMSLFCPNMQHADVCSEMSRLVFCLDYDTDLVPLWPCLFNVYDLCLQGQESKTSKLCKCSSSSLLVLEILAEGRAQHSLPCVHRFL